MQGNPLNTRTLAASPVTDDSQERLQQLSGIAEQLLAQLPERVRQGEMGAGEVTLLQQALLVVLVPDETQRQQRLALVQADVAKAMPPADTTQQALNEARRSEYKRREAAILADYQTRPEAQRNPAQLEAALEEARRAVYAPAN